MSLATVQMTDATAAAELRKAAKLKRGAEDLQARAHELVLRVRSGSPRAADTLAGYLPYGTYDASAYSIEVCAEELDTPELKRRRSA